MGVPGLLLVSSPPGCRDRPMRTQLPHPETTEMTSTHVALGPTSSWAVTPGLCKRALDVLAQKPWSSMLLG